MTDATNAPDALVPRKLQIVFAIMRCAPWTELKTFSGLVLLFLTAIWLVVADFFHVALSEPRLDTWLLFLSGLLTITAFGQGWKQSVAARVATPPPPPPVKP